MNGEAPTREKYSAIFRRMADWIDLNGEENFGGAFVIVPPKDGGDAIETLILDNRQDAAQFFGTLKTTAEISLNTVITQRQQRSAFGR